jgi:hypothetical protein
VNVLFSLDVHDFSNREPTHPESGHPLCGRRLTLPSGHSIVKQIYQDYRTEGARAQGFFGLRNECYAEVRFTRFLGQNRS